MSVYPDSPEGARRLLKETSTLPPDEIDAVTATPDPAVSGVWLLDARGVSADGWRAVVYLADDDFEVEDRTDHGGTG